MSEEPTPSPAPKPRPDGGRLVPPTWVWLLLMVAAVIVLGVLLGVVIDKFRPRPEGGQAEVTVEKVFTFTSPLPLPQQPLLEEAGQPLDTAIPTAVTVGDLTVPVVAVPTRDGKWPLPQGEDEAVWLYGTLINYVIGLPYSEETAATLKALGPGDLITLTLNNGHRLVFGSPQSRRIPSDETAPLAQTHPGLTLALLLDRESSERLIVQARHLPEATTTSTTQRLDDLEVSLVTVTVRDEESEALGGRPLLITYRLHNGSAASLDPSYFDLRLQDGEGRIFLVNPQVEALAGETTPTLVQPGETVTLTTGYLIPRETLPPLTWLFRPDPTREQSLRFDLPYHPLPPEPARPRVELLDAFIDGGRNLIVVNGVVHNDGEETLTVSLENIHLTSSQGESTLHSASPMLPWSIAGGQEQRFELQFSRPQDVSSVLVDILGFTFQLNGLP